jgi:hypothetical protein
MAATVFIFIILYLTLNDKILNQVIQTISPAEKRAKTTAALEVNNAYL